MTICLSSSISLSNIGYVTQVKKTFALKPHPYWNISYYFDPNIKPISLLVNEFCGTNPGLVPSEKNALAYIPNGLKVSATDNPLISLQGILTRLVMLK